MSIPFRKCSSLAYTAPLALILVLSACGPTAPPPAPTRVPAPTFTPTTEGQAPPPPPTPVPQAQANNNPPPQEQSQQGQPPQEQVPTTEPPPTDTPVPTVAEVTVNIALLNVRGGPGINYNVVGGAQAGQRYNVKGKNNDGTWWQIDFNGQDGWVFGELVTPQNTEAIAVAANIPAPPPPTNTPIPPPPTNTPPPAEPPTPAPPPKPRYEFNIAVAGNCARQEGGTWFAGKTYKNGQPKSGYKVVFSYAPDGPPVTEPQTTGPHEGYPNWDQGYYSHIISANGPRAGNWFVWVVNDSGQRISEIANQASDGPGGNCNQFTADFDSR